MAPLSALSLDERRAVSAGQVVVGLDEVGRGALAGPVVVGAVAIGGARRPPRGLDDSKALAARARRALLGPITAWADDWSLGWAGADEVDAWGLRLALAVAATRALAALRVAPAVALVDGNLNLLDAPVRLTLGAPEPPALAFAAMACQTVVGGDARCAAIAAASVLAKVHRDAAMRDAHRAHPRYGWASNVGYGAPAHLEALRRFGPTPLHRRSWALPERAERPGASGGAE